MAERSQDTYLGWVLRLVAFFPDIQAPDLGHRRVLDFLIHLQNECKLRPSTLNQAVCALRTLFRDHLGRDWTIWKDIKIKRDEPLPHVLTRGEVAMLLATFRDGRYRAYFSLVYHCGLRMSEALHIKPQHIDGGRRVVRVVGGKGGRSREVPVSEEMLAQVSFWRTKIGRFRCFFAIFRHIGMCNTLIMRTNITSTPSCSA